MKTFIIILILSCFWGLKRRFDKTADQNCNFFTNSTLKIDTIKLKGHYIGSVMLPHNSDRLLLILESEKLLKANEFSSSVLFKVDGCDTEYNLACRDNAFVYTKTFKQNQAVLLTCIVYKNKTQITPSEPPAIIIKIDEIR